MVFARVLPLEMQKNIINEAINLQNIEKLLIYSGYYLAAVFFFSALKYLTNVIQTLITQRTIARMRKGLFHHILTLPLSFFRNTQPGSVVNSLVTELAMPGNFVGMAVSAPVQPEQCFAKHSTLLPLTVFPQTCPVAKSTTQNSQKRTPASSVRSSSST